MEELQPRSSRYCLIHTWIRSSGKEERNALFSPDCMVWRDRELNKEMLYGTIVTNFSWVTSYWVEWLASRDPQSQSRKNVFGFEFFSTRLPHLFRFFLLIHRCLLSNPCRWGYCCSIQAELFGRLYVQRTSQWMGFALVPKSSQLPGNRRIHSVFSREYLGGKTLLTCNWPSQKVISSIDLCWLTCRLKGLRCFLLKVRIPRKTVSSQAWYHGIILY